MKKSLLVLFCTAAVFSLTACSSLSYYLDAAHGHMDLLAKAQPLDEILQQTDVKVKLRQQLTTFQQARAFASRQLHLPENNSYKTFSDLGRDYVVWNLVAANEFSTAPRQWCFLLVGCFSYRGYFEKHKVDAYALQLKQQGLDVYIAGVSAYSTLGWFDDPIVSSMLYSSEARRVGIVFHELAHQLMYRKNSTAFNESFAMAVEEEGIRRWFEYTNKPVLLDRYKEDKARSSQFHQMLLQTKNKLNQLYAQNLTATEKRQQKQQILISINDDYAMLRRQWGGFTGYDKWMSQPLNNAHFVPVQTYHELVPMFKTILKEQGNDLEAFYAEVIRISELDDGAFEREVLQRRDGF
jgi:predicted aminopeptidase